MTDLRDDGAYPNPHDCPENTDLPIGVHHMKCWSGWHRDLELPSLADFAQYGEIPDNLVGLALRAEDPNFAEGTLSREERWEYEQLIDHVVSKALRPMVDYNFVRGRDAKGKRIEPRLPREDRTYLWRACLRWEEMALWASFRDLGGIESDAGGVSAEANGAIADVANQG